ncbi:conserved hypothetical protein [Ricinus communis]|uniref:Retrotransposon gag domain-containing protein n=1 Tax=Ricinus communis TaxID=3988 RepID=B9SL44_RICCO|nr:conserved hypothetical protein [Ricinus communis]
MYDAWERFKDLLRCCPHHGLLVWMQVQTFYSGLNLATRQMVDAAAGGALNNKTPEQAQNLIEEMAMNNNQWQSSRSRPGRQGVVNQVDSTAALAAQVELLAKKIDQLQTPVHAANVGCEFCGSPHYSVNCTAGGKKLTGSSPLADKDNTIVQVEPAKEGPDFKVVENERMKEDRQKSPVREHQPPVPYPARLRQDKVDKQYSKFLDLFKQLKINLPFVEAISQMAKYAKFLKEILSNNRKLEDLGQVVLNEECSAILQNKLPLKRRDLESFTIPCMIGDLSISGALADLGASINLMPTSLFAKLGLHEPKPTRMSVQLADRTVKIPRGIIEDVLIKVDKFIFPVDFVVMDMEGESTVPLILGRPFLATSRAVIDVSDGKLKLRVDDETITFDLATSMRQSLDYDNTVYSTDVIDDVVESHLQEILCSDPLQVALAEDEEELSNEQVLEQLAVLLASEPSLSTDPYLFLDRSGVQKVKTSFKDPPVLKLKELPSHLV